MDLLWPGFLLGLLVIPAVIALYIWILRRRHRFAIHYSSLSLVREAIPRKSNWKRHIPMAIFLIAILSLVIALSRPATIVAVTTNQTAIIMAIDVSGSMRSRDIQPTRLQAAESAAISFIQNQKANTMIGLVAFSNFGEIIQPPTTDQEALQTAVESLTLGRRTAIGEGILTSIDAIAQIDHTVAPSVHDPSKGVEPTPVPKGYYAPDIIVLLTDGVSNTGILPMDAAKQATDRGIRVYTIGYGTSNGFIPFGAFGGPGGSFGNQHPGGQLFGGGGFGNNPGGFRTGIDEATLKQIASTTGGKYYTATSADELQKVFQNLPTYLITKHEIIELSVVFTGVGALLALLAISLSFLWRPLL